MIKIVTYVVTIICVLGLGLFNLNGNETENAVPMQVAEVENAIAESETENSSQLEVIEDSTVNQTEMPEETNVTQEQTVTTQPTITTQQNAQEKNTQESSSSKTTPITQVTTNSKPEQKQTQEQTQSQVNTDIPKQQTAQDQTSNNNKESFRENTAIINEIRNIINANPSTYMKQLGYNIVVDSSIVNLTTGFTYTQTRVRNAIANSFGTIRIYARDYYVGNELRWTEGFIL